jgi:hypothetical protein
LASLLSTYGNSGSVSMGSWEPMNFEKWVPEPINFLS